MAWMVCWLSYCRRSPSAQLLEPHRVPSSRLMEPSAATLKYLQDEASAFLCRQTMEEKLAALALEKMAIAGTVITRRQGTLAADPFRAER